MSTKRIIGIDERPPLGQFIPLSLQHMFAMFGASVLVPILFGINSSIVLFMNGLGTLLFIAVTKGRAPAYLQSPGGLSRGAGRICGGRYRGLYRGLHHL